jgi:hypothetical protein
MMRRITSIKQKYACWLAAGVIAFCAAPRLVAIPIYSSGDFKDPSADPLAPTDLSHAWYGGSDFNGANVLAQDFALSSAAVLDSVRLWTYDTIDGSLGVLQQIKYAIYSGTQPTGSPVADGIVTITDSAALASHRIAGLLVIQTSFDLVMPVSLVPGTTYWLALSAVTNPFGVSNIAKWADANVAGGLCLLQNGSGWDTMTGPRAFALDGQPESPLGVTVPDTGPTLALLAVGLAAVGWLRARLERGDNLRLAPAHQAPC